jgi:transcriptional regulator GlxA family with amidase domain
MRPSRITRSCGGSGRTSRSTNHSRITLADAARAAGLERTYLSTFFHRKVGIRFRDWLSLFRVEHAQRLLEQTDIGITQVALEVGFGDLRACERAFRRVACVCPAAFKRAVRPS